MTIRTVAATIITGIEFMSDHIPVSRMPDRLEIILSVTHGCNLRCGYCYREPLGREMDLLPLDTLKRLYALLKPYHEVVFVWHGGEPLLAPIWYYEETLKDQREVLNQIVVRNRIQTNGTLLNEEWLDFLESNGISLGISYDGIQNDSMRGHGKKVVEAMELCDHREFPYGLIHVVHDLNMRRLAEDYECYRRERKNVRITMVSNPSDPSEVIRNILDTYETWFFDTECRSSFRTFEEFVRMYLQKQMSCLFTSCLGKFLSVDSAGDIWPCTRYDNPSNRLGNVNKIDSLADCFTSNEFSGMLEKAIAWRQGCMERCEWYPSCQGGCSRIIIEEPVGVQRNSFCDLVRGAMSLTRKLIEFDNPRNPYVERILRRCCDRGPETAEQVGCDKAHAHRP